MQKNLTALILTILCTACAPDKSGPVVQDDWWSVTPVEIAEQQTEGFADMSALPAYRLVSAQGIRQTSLSKDVLGQASEGAKYAVMVKNYGERIALFACVNGTDYFTSNDSQCEGGQQIRLLGYLNREPLAETPRAVYRCGGAGTHFDTTDAAECAEAGLVAETILGYSR